MRLREWIPPNLQLSEVSVATDTRRPSADLRNGPMRDGKRVSYEVNVTDDIMMEK